MDLLVCNLGTVEYGEAAALQERLRERVIGGELPDLMLLLEHPPVYTVGRRSDSDELPLPEEHYKSLGIDVVRTPRGGKLTYHGPGQLVGYPIMHVANVPGYILTMERAIVAALGRAGIEATTRLGHKHVGVWVGERKIASVGVHLSHGVSSHGFAVNVDNDLAPFDWVVACGLPDVRMTSMAAEGASEGVACFRKRMGHAFCEAFGFRQRLVTPARLGIEQPVPA
ncbi:lipoyl(octanoyl) transferase LipB [Candidatus Solirubrobacter pratensis]|uniref:lipoyl(octanoyl) transferase LipB n=1 Tax=Candidatus Solirubrobacter pratensis TaxID=1298857 RepID=UPI000410D471|nr:lipoyl(octanoyl) transferase LipB [Candidatus Solirubrobacter pratensis]